jgi:hypothetical protein
MNAHSLFTRLFSRAPAARQEARPPVVGLRIDPAPGLPVMISSGEVTCQVVNSEEATPPPGDDRNCYYLCSK